MKNSEIIKILENKETLKTLKKQKIEDNGKRKENGTEERKLKKE